MSSASRDNLLIAALDRKTQSEILRLANHHHFESGTELIADGRLISHVFFPVDLVASVLIPLPRSTAVEVAIVGNEGVAGVSILLGPAQPLGRTVVQVAGTALQLRAAAFLAVSRHSPSLADLVNRYLFALLSQTVRTAACNQMHSMQARCARWLLQCQDRAGRQAFMLPHHLLASLMGVRRATVSEALGRLRARGFIDYSHGHLNILHRSDLERAACSCYEAIWRDYESVLQRGLRRIGTLPYPTIDWSSPQWHDPHVRVVVFLTSSSEDAGFLTAALRSVDCSLQMAAVQTLPQALALAPLGPAVLVCDSDIPPAELSDLFTVPAFQRIPFVQLSGGTPVRNEGLLVRPQPAWKTERSYQQIGKLICLLAGAA